MSTLNQNTKISLFRLIGDVCGNLGIKNVNQHLDDFARWAVDAEMKIGSKNSKERVECEIEIKNRRACLPDGFIEFIALKSGNEIINITKKDFRMFNKSVGVTVNDDSCPKFVGGNLQTTTTGVALAMRITLSGTYAPGDTIVVTVNINKCGTLSSNSFTYLVLGGDTLTTIATAIAAEINAIPYLGYSATAGAGTIDLLASDTVNTFTLGLYTSSVLGVITSAITQNHVSATTCDTELAGCDNSISTGSNNLAQLGAASITGAGAGLLNNEIFGFGTGNAKTFTIDNGYIFVNFMTDGKLGLAYYRVCLDENGWPLIDQSHETAVTAYLEWMYSRRELRMGKITHAYVKDTEMRWYWLCGQARGDDNMPNKAEMIYLGSIWNNLLPTKSLNKF